MDTTKGFPSSSDLATAAAVAQMVKNLPVMQKTRFDPWVGEIPWRRKWQPTPVLLPGEFHRRRSLVGYTSWSHKESDMAKMTEYAQSRYY